MQAELLFGARNRVGVSRAVIRKHNNPIWRKNRGFRAKIALAACCLTGVTRKRRLRGSVWSRTASESVVFRVKDGLETRGIALASAPKMQSQHFRAFSACSRRWEAGRGPGLSKLGSSCAARPFVDAGVAIRVQNAAEKPQTRHSKRPESGLGQIRMISACCRCWWARERSG